MEATTKRELALALLGFLAGGGGAALLAIRSGYGVAELFTSHRETQAYLLLLVVPILALVGSVTGAIVLSCFPRMAWKRVFLAMPGLVVLAGVALVGARFNALSRPGTLTVRNETTAPLEHCYVGRDFRRSTRVGTLSPGETSRPIAIDLDEPGTWAHLHGRWKGKQFSDRSTSDGPLRQPDWLYVVRESAGQLQFDMRAK